MHLISILLYNFITEGYFSAIKLVSLFNPKAEKWVGGRRHVFNELEKAFAFQKKNPRQVAWFHCSSLGEFEQGRTVIEALKKERPTIKVLLTFFSPSGYENRKNTPLADWVFYLPPDSKKNAKRFIDIIQPSVVVFVKYEFWYHYLQELKKLEIPVFLIAAVFRKGQLFFRKYGVLHREMLSCFETIFVQGEKSKSLLKKIDVNECRVAGDPRIDRVLAISGQDKKFPAIRSFCENSPVLVCGSTWQDDELILKDFIDDLRFKHWKIIIAPHDVSTKRIKEVKRIFGNGAILHSKISTQTSSPESRVLIIDSIGKLAWLYQFGKLAYIGGGFGKAIHNTLEPMAFNLPVVYGPKHTKFVEAMVMKKMGGHFAVHSSQQFLETMSRLEEASNLQQAKIAVSNFMERNKGASKTIAEHLRTYF